jgi:Ca2+-binding RTX toxin-like protein
VARLALSLVGLALLAPGASAGELFPTDGGAVFNALPGEVNRVAFTASSGRGIFADGRNPVATDEPCQSLSPNRASCPLGGPNAVGISLGDKDDRFRVARGSRLPRGSIVEGGKGDDRLRGGPGRERISGGRGNDVIFAGRGRDRVDCGPGRDRVIAERQDALSRCERVARP